MSGNLIVKPEVIEPIEIESSEIIPRNDLSEDKTITFDDAFVKYYINHDKEYKKYFKITNTKLVKEYGGVFNIKNRMINILPDKIEEAKNILKEFFDDLKNQRTYKSKQKYTLKTTGETKEYENEIPYRYKPKVKKFDFLRNNEKVVKILNDDNVRQCDKVHLIYDVLTEDEKKQVCISNLSNFVYREGYKK